MRRGLPVRDPLHVAKGLGRRVLDEHPGRPIAAAPDHGAVCARHACRDSLRQCGTIRVGLNDRRCASEQRERTGAEGSGSGQHGSAQEGSPARAVGGHLKRAGTVPSSRADGTPDRPGFCVAARTIASAIASAASAPTMATLASPSQRTGREREDRVAVAGRVHRRDRARVAVVRHLRDLLRLDLRQLRVGRDDRRSSCSRRRAAPRAAERAGAEQLAARRRASCRRPFARPRRPGPSSDR